jgi:hypothetical protein
MRKPSLTTVGTFGVGGAAAALSFDSLRGLAELLGFRPVLTFLFPLAIDLYALVVTRVWLGAGDHGKDVRAWAARNTWLSILLSVAGNALYHALISGIWSHEVKDPNGIVHIHVDAPIIVIVSAVPPIVLGLVVHLRTIITRDRNAIDEVAAASSDEAATTQQTAPAPEALEGVVVDAEPLNEEPATPPSALAMPALPAIEPSQDPRKQVEQRRRMAIEELQRLKTEGKDLSVAGFNQAFANRYRVSVPTVEKWKQAAFPKVGVAA